MNKLFALCAAAFLLAACSVTNPTAEGPIGPPPGAKEFTIFFETASAKLDSVSMATLDKAAASYKAGGVSQVTAVGHADTEGSATSNMDLSLRRADAVKAALATRGVPAANIAVVARGEEDLPVKTEDNLAEPKNRIVKITLK